MGSERANGEICRLSSLQRRCWLSVQVARRCHRNILCLQAVDHGARPGLGLRRACSGARCARVHNRALPASPALGVARDAPTPGHDSERAVARDAANGGAMAVCQHRALLVDGARNDLVVRAARSEAGVAQWHAAGRP
jgi:hypothetical protein